MAFTNPRPPISWAVSAIKTLGSRVLSSIELLRVRVLIDLSAGASVETSALTNTSYEMENPEVLLPRPLAEHHVLPT